MPGTSVLKFILAILIGLFDIAVVAAPTSNWTLSQKPELLSELRRIQEKHFQRREKIESQIRAKVGSTQNSENTKDHRLSVISQDLLKLQTQMIDLNRKRDFLDRLAQIFQNQWHGQTVSEFLSAQLLEFAVNELSNTDRNMDSLALYATYLSAAIRELKDPDENIFDFINAYIEVSTVINPTSPQQFLKTRHYANRVTSAQAQVVPKEQLGEELEKLVKSGIRTTPEPIQGETKISRHKLIVKDSRSAKSPATPPISTKVPSATVQPSQDSTVTADK